MKHKRRRLLYIELLLKASAHVLLREQNVVDLLLQAGEQPEKEKEQQEIEKERANAHQKIKGLEEALAKIQQEAQYAGAQRQARKLIRAQAKGEELQKKLEEAEQRAKEATEAQLQVQKEAFEAQQKIKELAAALVLTEARMKAQELARNKRMILSPKEREAYDAQLLKAAQDGNSKEVERLLYAGANIEAVDKDGLTPLHMAAWNGRTELVKLLIDNCAQIETVTDDGSTPLHVAAENGHTEVVQLLLGRGANKNVVAKNGKTPLKVAQLGGYTAVVDLLIRADAT